MSWEAWARESRLRWRVERRRIERLIARTHTICDEVERAFDLRRAFLSFSGGKDSLVMVALLAKRWPDMAIVHYDVGTRAMPGLDVQLAEVEAALGVRVRRVWVDAYHARLHDALGTPMRVGESARVDERWERFEDFNHEHGFEGSFIGLRSDESKTRARACQRTAVVYRGAHWTKLAWRAAPIGHWDTGAVWAYIVGNDLPVHRAYVDQIDAGVEPHLARTASLALHRVVSYGALGREAQLWRDEVNRLRQDNPDMYF